MLLARDVESTFNWFSLLEFYLVASQLLAMGLDALLEALSLIYFKDIYQTLSLYQALFVGVWYIVLNETD